ncbi:MAG: hypothetical protein WB612_07335, partial [Nitrososphaeraceae archaeon]
MSSSFYAEAEQGIGTFYANGTIISVPGSSNTVDDSIPNATSASISDGNWSLAVENGIVKKFDASLVSSGKSGSSSMFHLSDFKSTADKSIQLGSRGSNIIKGTVKIFSKDKNEYSNVGMTIMISNLNRTNIVLDKDNSFQIKSPILGLVHFVGDADGNIIRNNLALNVSETNQVENISQTKSVEELGSASDLPTSGRVVNNGVSGDIGSEGGDIGSEGGDIGSEGGDIG